MQLINTDGMAFIGPGSEWFWTALTGVVLGLTFIAIYRQLAAQAAANTVARQQSLYAEWSTYDMQYRRLVLALHLKYEGIQGTVVPGNLTWEKAQPVVSWMNDVAYLVKKGHVDFEEITSFSSLYRQWVVALRPFFEVRRSSRVAYGLDDQDLEWLAARFEDWNRKQDAAKPLTPTNVWLDDVIDRTTANLRLEQERKAGIIPGPPVTVD